jgi:DAK2 domain fusion protein YloV
MEAVVAAAAESVANTPNLLPVLKEAGVVDAGGEGVYVILDGALRYLKGEAEQMQFRKPQMIVSDMTTPATRIEQVRAMEEVPYGYCTEFLIKGKGLNPDRIRVKLAKKGESLIVVGDESTVRVHIHTLDPGKIIHYATSLGTIHQTSMRNMDEQHHDWLDMQKEKMPDVDTAIVAVVSGLGLSNVFRSLGATAIVSGGQTMNPSTKDILRAVESSASDKAIILPNNKNIILTAEQVQSLTEKKIVVIPTKTVPQGVAALLSFDYDADFETNTKNMEQARNQVKSIEITRAVRSTELNGFSIKKKQAIGFLEGELVAVGDDIIPVLNDVLAKVDLGESEVITIYYGSDTEVTEAEQVSQSICEQNPELQVDVVQGGQPHYYYIVSIE